MRTKASEGNQVPARKVMDSRETQGPLSVFSPWTSASGVLTAESGVSLGVDKGVRLQKTTVAPPFWQSQRIQHDHGTQTDRVDPPPPPELPPPPFPPKWQRRVFGKICPLTPRAMLIKKCPGL